MKNIRSATFGVRFFRRVPQKKVVNNKTPTIPMNANNDCKTVGFKKKYKKHDLSMIFINKSMGDIKCKTNGFFAFSFEKNNQKGTSSNQIELKNRALWAAAQNGDCYAIRLLVMGGVDLDARDGKARTALNIATQYNHKDAIKTIMAAKEMRKMAELGELPHSIFFDKFKKSKSAQG